MADKVGILIQARMGSTRLPNKMAMEFVFGKSIFEIVIEKLLTVFDPSQIVLATSLDAQNSILIQKAKNFGINYYCGSENNVLDRFILASKQFGFTKIIRICADNPFLQQDLVKTLFDKFENSNADYISWFINNLKPSIKTHTGYFAEAVKISALKTIKKSTKAPLYLEHVTNFLYENKDKFNIEWIPLFDEKLVCTRLTIDTIEDFKISQQIYRNCFPAISIDNINNYLEINKKLLELMKENILKNEK